MIADCIIADYANKQQAQTVADLHGNYANDPKGGGEPLDAKERESHVVMR